MSAEEKELLDLENQIVRDHGYQGRLVVEDVRLKKRSYYDRVVTLYAVQQKLAGGAKIHGTPREVMNDEEYKEFLELKASVRKKTAEVLAGRKPAKGEPTLLGSQLSKPEAKPGEPGSKWCKSTGGVLVGDGSNVGGDDDIPF